MALETTVILRTILYQAMKAKTKEEIVNAISVMCSKEDIATVKEQIAKEEALALQKED
jgi:hypothetical protein